MNIRRLIEIQCYRGLRHRRNLPVRGQRTHTNARTRKGPRKGAVAAKKSRRAEVIVISRTAGESEFCKLASLRGGTWQKNRSSRAPRPRQQRRKLPSARKKFKKKREKRIVPHGVAHIQATFNNTIITICGPDGRTVCMVFGRLDRFQGLAQRHAVCRAAGFRDRCGSRSRPVRDEIGRGAREGPGLGPRIGRAGAGLVGLAYCAHQGCDADPAQRMPSAQAPPRLIRAGSTE
jgi:hypothetical protein